MKKQKRWMVALLCTLVLILPILLESFIATHRVHQCTGKDCGVCLEIRMAEQLMFTLRTIIPATVCSGLFIRAFALSRTYQKQIHRVGNTLITLKVELLN